MHKVILVYGPTTMAELERVVDRRVGEEIRDTRLLDVLSVQGMPASVGPWNLVFEMIKAQINLYNDAPSIALFHESQLAEGYVGYVGLDSMAEFDAILSYAYDPETGYNLVKLFRPWNDYTGDWWVVGGRWSGLLVPKAAEAQEVITEYPNLNALGLLIDKAVSGEKPDTGLLFEPMVKAMGRNSLKVGDVDWEATQLQSSGAVPVDEVLRVSKTHNLKCVELLFEEIYGNDLRALPEEQQAAFRVNQHHAIWSHFWRQLESNKEAFTKEDRTTVARHSAFLGYSREQLERYNAISGYLQGGVVYGGHYFDGEPDPVTADPVCMDGLIKLGELLRDLPSDVVVTVVDVHY